MWTQYAEGDMVKKVTIPPNATDVVLTLSDDVVKQPDTDGGGSDDCGCSTVGGQQGWLAIALLGLVGVIRRRRSLI